MTSRLLVIRMLEDEEEVDPKDELMRLPHWRESVVRTEAYEFLTDRDGEIYQDVYLPPHVEQDINQLRPSMGTSENCFVVRRKRDHKLGLLWEYEFLNPESPHEMADDDTPTGDDVAKDLIYKAGKLQEELDHMEVTVTQGDHIFNARFAVCIFLPAVLATPAMAELVEASFNRVFHGEEV